MTDDRRRFVLRTALIVLSSLVALFVFDAVTGRELAPATAVDLAGETDLIFNSAGFKEGESAHVVVPDGYTRALVNCSIAVSVLNRSDGTFSLSVSAAIDGTRIGLTRDTVPAGYLETSSASTMRSLEGLQGGQTIRCAPVVWTSQTTDGAISDATLGATFYP